jgi:ParB-like chromosome segregation protein Spo0J
MSKPTQMIDLRDIVVQPNRMRQLRPEVVDELAASIASEGLLQPIVVRPDPEGVGFLLVAGWHRFAAKRKLKHETTECRVLDGLSADQARVAEIDENLIRADLTPSERAAHHAERKALYLKLHPETKHGGAPGKAGGGKKAKDAKLASFVKDIAKKTGKAKRTIARDVSRGEKIDPQALADLAGTCLDNGTELDALAKLPAPEQRSLAEAAKRGEKVSAITVLSACDFEARKTSLDTGKAPCKPNRRNKANRPPTLDPQAWSMSTAQQRQAFVAAIGRSEIEDAIANEFHRAAAPKAEITETIEGTSHDGSAETDALAKLPEAEKQSLAEATKGGKKGSAVTAHNASACETGAVPEVIPDREQPQADDRDIAAAGADARWLSRYEAIKARQAALAQELEALYRPFQAMMVELLHRIEDVDGEARRVNDAKPATSHGDGRLLGNTESIARAPGGLSIVKDLKLPAWEGDSIPAWPPQQLLPLQIAASMGSQSAAEELKYAIAREASRRKAAEARAAEEKLRRETEGRRGG